MAVHKVLGTEVEYGIAAPFAAEFNPVLASSAVINAYAGDRARIQWSFDEETPGKDARGRSFGAKRAPDVEGALLNVVLSNGARFYVDHAHPEYSAPEGFDAWEGALYDKAGEVVMARAVAAARELPGWERLVAHKNNSDGKGNSYGAHENFLLARELPFGEVVRHFTPFLISRQIFTGSGKIGSENGRPEVGFQISQRADFFEEEVGLETTLKRPIINTRDEPHADSGQYRRLHVIIGDANLSEPQTFLKLGSAALILSAIEDGALPASPDLQDPVDSVWRVSHDTNLRAALPLANGSSATALELQWQYFEWATKYARGIESNEVTERLLALWEGVLADLETDLLRTADRLDWTAKLALLIGYRERDGLDWDDPKLRLLDLQYHDVDPARGLYHRLASRGRVQRLFTDADVDQAVDEPPRRTRAFFRGECVRRFGPAIVSANWDSMVFDTGEASLKRVPMMEPLRGTHDHVGALLDDSEDVASLLRNLRGGDG